MNLHLAIWYNILFPHLSPQRSNVIFESNILASLDSKCV